METMLAMMMGEMHRGNEPMVFDWAKAAKLIKEKNPQFVMAGLKDDWEWTGGEIFVDGEVIKNDYTYLQSTWAIPQIMIDDEIIDCYVMSSERPEWNAETLWPEEALDILFGKGENDDVNR